MPDIKRHIARFLLSLMVALLAGLPLAGGDGLRAQDAIFAQEDLPAQAEEQIANAQKKLEDLHKLVETNITDDTRLVDTKVKIDAIIRELLQISVSLRPRFEEVKSRLAQLGDPPQDGQPAEAPEVTEERNRLAAERLKINTLTGDAENLSISATKLSNAITQIRRELFTDRLLEHTDISASVLSEAWSSLSTEADSLVRTVGSWVNFIWNYKRVQLGSAIMLSLVTALLLLTAEYRLFGSLIHRDPENENPSYMSRISVAFWSTILPALAFGALLVSTYFFLDTFNVLRRDIAPIVGATFGFAGLVFFVALLSRAILAPKAPSWRLVGVSNQGARQLGLVVLLMAVVNAFDYVLGSISEALSSPIVLTVMKSLISSLVVGLLILLISFLKPVISESGDPSEPGRHWPRWIITLLRLTGIGLILSGISGYVGLSRFLATQIVVTGAVVSTMYIGMLSAQAISAQNRFGETRVGKFLGTRFNLDPVALDQAGLAAGLLIYLFVLIVGIPLILISWGFQLRDLELWAYNLFTEISIGTIRISLFGIVGGVLLFIVGLVATRWFQKWLDGNVMARSHMDAGVRNSVRTGIGYLGTAIAGLVGVSAAGIDLSSLALVAGALSLGIGFGLQNIVSNFVSGLILLAERPFKVGDWVATGTTEGFVRRISVRATEIETFQRQSIIVPNSELINASVGNWTHRNNLGRVEIRVGTSYNSNPRRVMDILLEIAHAHPSVLRNPEPFVLFDGFGDSSLDFELRIFIGDVLNGLPVRNDLRLAIFERFAEEKIEIPFPQRDLHVHMAAGNGSDGSAAAGDATKIPAKGPKPKGRSKRIATEHLDDGNDGDGDIS